MKQTATQWLFEKLWETPKDKLTWNAILEQAKEMEKKQIIDCCIETTQDCFKAVMNYMGQEINFTKEDLQNQKIESEIYYKETYDK
jgi:hypothetical protein